MSTYEECPACGEYIDYCMGGHGTPCDECAGYADAHTRIECVGDVRGHDGGVWVVAYPIHGYGHSTFHRDDVSPVVGQAYGIGVDAYTAWSDSIARGYGVTFDVYVTTVNDDNEPDPDTLAYATGADPYPDYRLTVRQDSQVWEVC